MSGSPLVVNGMVVVSPGGENASLAAYDEQTGSRVWVGGHAGASYSSPQYAAFVERPQIFNFNAEGLFGHNAASGEVILVEASPDRHRELARFAALDDRTWNHPVVSGDILLVRNDREAACYQLPCSN